MGRRTILNSATTRRRDKKMLSHSPIILDPGYRQKTSELCNFVVTQDYVTGILYAVIELQSKVMLGTTFCW